MTLTIIGANSAEGAALGIPEQKGININWGNQLGNGGENAVVAHALIHNLPGKGVVLGSANAPAVASVNSTELSHSNQLTIQSAPDVAISAKSISLESGVSCTLAFEESVTIAHNIPVIIQPNASMPYMGQTYGEDSYIAKVF